MSTGAGYAENRIRRVQENSHGIAIARLIMNRVNLSGDNNTFLTALLGQLVGSIETATHDTNYQRVIDALVIQHGVSESALTDSQIADGLRLDSYWQAVAGV